MWSTEVSKNTKADPATIWNLWSRVSEWNLWDNDVEYASLDFDFGAGSTGILKPKKGPKTKFLISECTENRSFTTESKLPLGKMRFMHSISQNGELNIVKHRVEIEGFFTFLFSRVIGKNIEKSLPDTMDTLISITEKK